MILLQRSQRVFGHLYMRTTILRAELLQKLFDQQRNILFAITQRRNKKWNYIQPIKKILAKIPTGNLFLKILIRRSDHPHIHMHRMRRTHRQKPLFIERTQHFGLRLQAHIPDLVEK